MSAKPFKTIHQRWEEFELRMLAEGAPATQRQELRLAFFAGFTASLAANLEIDAMGCQQGLESMQLLQAESCSFARSL